MDHSEQMKQLMERLEIIEQKLNYISLTSVQKLDGYHIENITIGNNCKLDMQNCSAGNITIGNKVDLIYRTALLERSLIQISRMQNAVWMI